MLNILRLLRFFFFCYLMTSLNREISIELFEYDIWREIFKKKKRMNEYPLALTLFLLLFVFLKNKIGIE